MPTFRLGRDQVIVLDGSELPGSRDVEWSLDVHTEDITNPMTPWAATLPIGANLTFRIQLVTAEAYSVAARCVSFEAPKVVAISIGGGSDVPVVLTSLRAGIPIDGAVTWDAEFALWSYAL